nr:MAG TPA: hypothetical protein [Caudoviricetes sp.]
MLIYTKYRYIGRLCRFPSLPPISGNRNILLIMRACTTRYCGYLLPCYTDLHRF